MSKTDISIIIPCYNEGPTLEKSIKKIVGVLKETRSNWEIIFVEDKSSDDTKKNVDKLIKKYKNFRTIYHTKNQGRGESVADGIKIAKGQICGYLDVDLEVSERYIPLFIREIEKGSELVAGKRFYEGEGLRTIPRFLASKVYAFAVQILFNCPIEDTEAGYKFFNRKKILPILKHVKNKHWFWDTEICVRAYLAGLNIGQIPVLFKRRKDKKSTVRLLPDTVDYIRNLIRLKLEIPK